jgi:hypothetical protein
MASLHVAPERQITGLLSVELPSFPVGAAEQRRNGDSRVFYLFGPRDVGQLGPHWPSGGCSVGVQPGPSADRAPDMPVCAVGKRTIRRRGGAYCNPFTNGGLYVPGAAMASSARAACRRG